VLDVNGKAHEIDNLCVADTSFFPSIAAVSPGLTAMANAIRAGEHIEGRLGVSGVPKSGRLPRAANGSGDAWCLTRTGRTAWSARLEGFVAGPAESPEGASPRLSRVLARRAVVAVAAM
jgi:hypothetical protein